VLIVPLIRDAVLLGLLYRDEAHCDVSPLSHLTVASSFVDSYLRQRLVWLTSGTLPPY
jgi:hypothetical protein